MSYEGFAKIYDRLIGEDISYGEICDFIENIFHLRGINPSLVLDMACGTGGVTIPMAARGYDMLGADRSAQMLDLARKKPGSDGILFLNQSITSLDLYGTVGAALCITDGFNYVLSDDELTRALTRLRTCFLDPGAVLIFDVSSAYKYEKILADNTFVYDRGGVFYCWENRYMPKKQLCEMNITFFEKGAHGWRKTCERQLHRARTEARLRGILTRAGFSDIEVFSSTGMSRNLEGAQRLWFVAQNK